MSIISELRSEMVKIQDKIILIQTQCSHPDVCVTKTHRSSDSYDDTKYWTDFYCSLCEKKWMEDGSK